MKKICFVVLFFCLFLSQIYSSNEFKNLNLTPLVIDGEETSASARLVQNSSQSAKINQREVLKNQPNIQNISALTVIPPRLGDDFSLILKPGQSEQVTLEVYNPTNFDININTVVKDFIVSSDGETPIPIEEDVNNRFSLAKWMQVVPESQNVASKTSVKVNIVIKVPTDAIPGGRYAMILHRPNVDNKKTTKSGTSVVSQIGTLLYAVVDGEVDSVATIDNFKFNSQEFGPIPYNLAIKNESSYHIRPKITIKIYNIFNKLISSFQEETKNIFPGTIREYNGYYNKIWGLGFYRANLLVEYGLNINDSMKLEDTSKFWIIPIRLIIVFLIILFLIIIFINAIIKKYRYNLISNKETITQLNKKIEEFKKMGSK